MPGKHRSRVAFSSNGDIRVPQYLGGCDVRVALEDIQRQFFNGSDLFWMIRREVELAVVIRRKIDDFNADGGVIQIATTTPLADARMPGSMGLIRLESDL